MPDNTTTVILHLVASAKGGAASHVRDLALGQVHLGHTVHVLMPQDNGNLTAAELTSQGIRFQAIPIDEGFSFQAWRQLRHYIRQHQIHIFHAHGARAAFWGRLAIMALGRQRPKLVYTIHGLMIPHYGRARRTLLTIQEKLQAPQVDHYIAVSHAEKENLERLGLGKKGNVSVVWYGIDVEAFARPQIAPAIVRQQFGFTDDHIVLAMICRFFWPRDFPTLLHGFHLARQENDRLRLLLVGAGPWQSQIESLLNQLALHPYVVLPGLRRDISDLLHASDIFVLTSGGGDGLPISILEAMAAGRPVIATDSDGIPEEILPNQTGYLTAKKDHDALATAICSMAASKRQQLEMGAAGQQRAQAYFTRAQMLSNTEQIYTRITARASKNTQ